MWASSNPPPPSSRFRRRSASARSPQKISTQAPRASEPKLRGLACALRRLRPCLTSTALMFGPGLQHCLVVVHGSVVHKRCCRSRCFCCFREEVWMTACPAASLEQKYCPISGSGVQRRVRGQFRIHFPVCPQPGGEVQKTAGSQFAASYLRGPASAVDEVSFPTPSK